MVVDKHLRARVASSGGLAQVNPYGGVTPFATEHNTGSVFLAQRPRPERDIPFAHDVRLTKFGGSNCFELQIQCCLSGAPRGPLWICGELRGGMKLNLVTRALCRVLLGLIQTQATKRGVGFRYHLGNAQTLAHIAVPLLAVDRVIFSRSPLALPTDTDEARGAWLMEDGKLVPVDRDTVSLEAGMCVTALMGTTFLDFDQWSLVGIPGVGSLDLVQFWRDQPMHVVIYDEGPAPGDRRVLCDLELSSTVERAEAEEAPEETRADGGEAREDEVMDTVVDLVDAVVEEAPDGSQTLGLAAGQDSQDEHDSQDESSDEDPDDPKAEGDEWESRSEISRNTSTILGRLNEQAPQDKLFDSSADAICLEDIAAITDNYVGGSVSIPWYFINGAEDLWWCIDYQGRQSWRHHSQLRTLCAALGAQLPQIGAKSSLRDLERGRRVANVILTQGCSAPGLLEEFTRIDVSLRSLLSGEVQPKSQAVFVGVVEAEGRIVERYVRTQGRALRWVVRLSRHHRLPVCVRVDLRQRLGLAGLSVAGAEAVKLAIPQKAIVFVAKDRRHFAVVEQALQGAAIEDGGSSPSSGRSQAAAQAAAAVAADPAASWARALSGPLASRGPGTVVSDLFARLFGGRLNASSIAAKAAEQLIQPPGPWKDLLMRWPTSRIVLNDAEPFLEAPPPDPLRFSSGLLRGAVAAQGAPEGAVHELTVRCGGLKCIALQGLGPQDLWGFWVNVFHCLLIHSQLTTGQPGSLQTIVGLYNKASYLVAGHAFSLVEIEHFILRRHMTQPKIRLMKTIMKIWKRTDEDLLMRPCLAAPVCPAACFACRPDWRLNLILNAGNQGSADAIPIFEPGDEAAFDQMVQHAMERTLASCGCVTKDAIDLPYNLYRYRGDAPPGAAPQESVERRWARAVLPHLADTGARVRYNQNYGWAMRQRLDLLSVKGGCTQ